MLHWCLLGLDKSSMININCKRLIILRYVIYKTDSNLFVNDKRICSQDMPSITDRSFHFIFSNFGKKDRCYQYDHNYVNDHHVNLEDF